MYHPEPLALPADHAAPGMARRYVTAVSVHAAWSRDLVDLALLVTSELVTNAVVHGRAPIELTVRAGSSTVRIEVGDGGAGAPVLVDGKPDAVRLGGRGVFLLDQLAARWGSQPRAEGPGKTVWADLEGVDADPSGQVSGR